MASRSGTVTAPTETDPLILALAQAVRSAVVRRRQLVTWAVEHGVDLVEACSCQHQTSESDRKSVV